MIFELKLKKLWHNQVTRLVAGKIAFLPLAVEIKPKLNASIFYVKKNRINKWKNILRSSPLKRYDLIKPVS